MARRRDYKKELAQRNEKARRQGYSNYNRSRKALETGKAVRGEDGRLEAPPRNDPRHAYVRAGFEDSIDGAKAYAQMQRENEAWIREHSKSEATKLRRGASPEEQRDFYEAFTKKANRNKLLDMKQYLVDDLGIYSPAEFDRKYFKK